MPNEPKNQNGIGQAGGASAPGRAATGSATRLGELLVRENLISAQQLQRAIEAQRLEGGRLGFHLTKLGLIDEKQLTGFIAKQYRIPAIDLRKIEIAPEIIKLVPREIAQKHLVVPVNRSGQDIILAMSDPSNIFAIDDVKFVTNYNVNPVVASEEAIQEAIEKYYGAVRDAAKKDASAEEASFTYEDVMTDLSEEQVELAGEEEDSVNVLDLKAMADDAPVIKLANLILLDAIKKGASDIHVEPYEKEYRVRYRIDGVLYEVMKPPLKLKNALTSRLKIMSGMDIAERRLPQDGRIKLKLGKERDMDFRVNCLPTLFGEKVCLRLLDKSNLQLDMTKLGFDPEPLRQFKDAINRPYGMVLVTGPTGSGKTTSLYSALAELNETTENISTAEDPVEFNFAGINQVHMHEEIGLNFAAALRAFLRQDPDIIMVGEIRDFETAEIAIKAALTGHLVLSTLHTNDAPSTIGRLLNMGIEPFMVAASVNLILAQRLGRRICANCKEEDTITTEETLRSIQVPEDKIGTFKPMKGRGCEKCNGRGLKGRVAFYEVMPYTDELKELTINGASTAELKAESIRQGMKSLRMAAIAKMIEGVTTADEVAGNTAPD